MRWFKIKQRNNKTKSVLHVTTCFVTHVRYNPKTVQRDGSIKIISPRRVETWKLLMQSQISNASLRLFKTFETQEISCCFKSDVCFEELFDSFSL